LAVAPAHAQWFSFGAENGAAPVWLTGNYRLLGQTSSRQGSFQEKPPDLWRAEVNPTLAIYGVPITANLLVSSEQRDVRQNINAFSVTLDPDAIKRIVSQRAANALEGYARSESGELLDQYSQIKDSLAKYDPEKLKELDAYKKIQEMREVANGDITNYTDVLQQMGLMSDVENVMQQLPTVGVGTVFPAFTPMTLSGSRVSGGWGDWNPGGSFYIAGVGGTTQQPLRRVDSIRVDTTVYTTLDNSDYGRSLYGGRIGYGRPEGIHVILTGLYATDDATTLTLPDSGVALTPMRNYITGLSVRVDPFPGVWSLEAELCGSLTEGDQNAPRFASPDVPDFLLDLVDSSSSVYADWAAAASTTINIQETGTRLTGKARRIGMGYSAPGVPNLRTDYIRYDVRADQRFWKRQVSLGLFVRRDEDNLSNVKRATSTLFSYGGSLGLNFRGWPYLRLSYAPYIQESNSSDVLLQYKNQTLIWSVAGGYAYRVGDLGMNTNVTFSKQDATTKNNVSDYAVTTINFLQSVSFTFPLTLSVGVGNITQAAAQTPTNNIFTTDFSANYAISDWFTTNGGITLAFDETYGTRSGYFLSVLMRLGQFADIDLRAEHNIFNELVVPPVLGGSYSENIFRVTVGKVW
jgi:hypothetical protein